MTSPTFPKHIVNLTRTKATFDQSHRWGIFDVGDREWGNLVYRLSPILPPTQEDIEQRAGAICALAHNARLLRFGDIPVLDWPPFGAMIDGPGPLVRALRRLLYGACVPIIPLEPVVEWLSSPVEGDWSPMYPRQTGWYPIEPLERS